MCVGVYVNVHRVVVFVCKWPVFARVKVCL